MYIKRKIEDDIFRYLQRPEILAIVGPRQCGKTTLMRKIYSDLDDAVFLSFEDQQILSLFEKNIKGFAETYVEGKRHVFIDEFQYAKNGGKLLKYLYDLHHTKIIISGSSATDLTIKAIRYLVGRVFVLNMYPFDFLEYLSAKDENYKKIYIKYKANLKEYAVPNLAYEQSERLRRYYEEYCVWGGYPQVVLTDNKEVKKEILRNIYNTYFLRDVKTMLGLIDDFKLGKLIQGLALQIGKMVEYNELSQMSELAATTVKKYFNFLSKTYIAELIKSFYKNKRKEIVKAKKVYFYDTGLRNFIVNDFRPLAERTDTGQLIENGFYIQIIKNGYIPQYWRDKNQNEVDFIID
ncbi:hypothetical protein A2Y83_04250, partial [Candidatus Falkowbacteria bacterium RBG_13_39_14]